MKGVVLAGLGGKGLKKLLAALNINKRKYMILYEAILIIDES